MTDHRIAFLMAIGNGDSEGSPNDLNPTVDLQLRFYRFFAFPVIIVSGFLALVALIRFLWRRPTVGRSRVRIPACAALATEVRGGRIVGMLLRTSW